MKKQKCSISVIGLGQFGTLTAAILSKYFAVKIYHYKDTSEKRSLAKQVGAKFVDFNEACQSDIIILTVPISNTEEMIKNVAKKAKKGSLIMDTCSVKAYPCRWLKNHVPKEIDILGTHPMFGPMSTKFDPKKKHWELEKKQIVLCPLRISANRLNFIKLFLKQLKLEIIETTPEDHDRQNAKTLSFVHFLGRSLMKAGIGEQKIYTPGYLDILKIIPHTNRDSWQLFCDMNNYNPYSGIIRDKFIASGEELVEGILKSNSKTEKEFHEKAIKNIDKQIKRLERKRKRHNSF